MLVRYIYEQVCVIFAKQSPKSKRTMWAILVSTLLMGFIELGVAGMVSLLGVALTAPQAVLELSWVKLLITRWPSVGTIAHSPALVLVILLTCVVGGVCLKNLLLGVLTYMQNLFSQAVSASLGTALFRSYMKKPYVWYLDRNVAELSSILDFRVYIAIFLINFFSLTTQGIITAFLLAGGFFFAPLSTLLVFGTTGAAGAATYFFSRKKIQKCNETIIIEQIAVRKLLIAGCQGIRDVQVYQQGNALTLQVEERLAAAVRHLANVATLPTVPMWTLESVGMLSLLLALAVMILMDSSLASITGTLTLLAAMAWRLLPSLNKTINAVVSLQGQREYVDRFFSILDETSTLQTKGDETTDLIFNFERTISLCNIYFRYPSANHDSLRNVTMEIPKGSMIGIVGPSGAGKSTLTGILTNLLTPDSGHIEVDGKILTQGSGLCPILGYVPQSPYLLDATLAENIAFSRLGEPIDEERVLRACRMAAFNFWEQLPEGIHTELGERGMKLSGGQAQRVAIARALYSEPELLIFDEATSSLDSATENAIQQTIAALRKNTTMVIIAHRLSTLEHCDVVYLIENGVVTEFGSPEQILPHVKMKDVYQGETETPIDS